MGEQELIQQIKEHLKQREADGLYIHDEGQSWVDLFLQPHVMSVEEMVIGGDPLETEDPHYERDGEVPNRLEELRLMASAAGVPEEQIRDDKGFRERLFTFIGSDESIDRYNSRILVDGTWEGKRYGKGWILDNFKRAPRFMPFHQYSTIPVGRALDVWKARGKDGQKRLKFQILMDPGVESNGASPLAQNLTRAYSSRLMESVSVGWWPHDVYRPANDEEAAKLWGLNPKRWPLIFATSELWELSAVSIPGNPNARIDERAVGEDEVRSYLEFADMVHESSPAISLQIRSALGAPPKPTTIGVGGASPSEGTGGGDQNRSANPSPLTGEDFAAMTKDLQEATRILSESCDRHADSAHRLEELLDKLEKVIRIAQRPSDGRDSVFDKVLRTIDETINTVDRASIPGAAGSTTGPGYSNQ